MPTVSLASYTPAAPSQVVLFDNVRVPVVSMPAPMPIVKEGSYLITGGLGGLGLQLASWLVQRGAGHLILTGRQGAASTQAQDAVRALEANGARITVVAADVANAGQLTGALDKALQGKPPLKGVIHAASTFSSEFIYQFAADEMRKQMQAKAVGALNLHTYTEAAKLDFFVLISSMAAQIGSHGQSAYAASNAFLDALAVHRRVRGLPATSVNLGAIGNVGILNNQQDYAQRLDKVGLLAMDSQQVVEVINHALEQGWDHITASHMNWARFFEGFPAMKQSMTFRNLLTESEATSTHQGAGDEEGSFQQLIEGLSLEERSALLVSKLRELSAAVFGSTVEQLDPQIPLLKLGMDSLMAAQLRDKIESELQLKVRIMTIVRGPSVEQLASTLLTQLAAVDDSGHVVAGRVNLDALENALADVEAMIAPPAADTSKNRTKDA